MREVFGEIDLDPAAGAQRLQEDVPKGRAEGAGDDPQPETRPMPRVVWR